MIKNYAVLDDNNYVINVIVSEDEIEYFENNRCIEYSEEGLFRSNPAQIGCKYFEEEDVFISRQPYHSWTLNTSTYKWEPPIAKPEGLAAWDELNKRWNSPEA